MALTRQKKEIILKDLIEKFGKAKSIIFAKNLGLSVQEISELRQQLREKEVDFKIAKKTLMKLAVKEMGINDLPDEIMDGPVAAAVSYGDQVSAANILHKVGKATQKVELVGGILDGEILDGVKVKYLATLPTKDQLIAKFIATLQSPIYGFHGTLKGVLSGFVRVVNAYKDQKPAEEVKASASAEATADKEEPKEEAKSDEA